MILSSFGEIREGIAHFWENNFTQETLPNITLPIASFKQFSEASVTFMEEIPIGYEIKDEVRSCD